MDAGIPETLGPRGGLRREGPGLVLVALQWALGFGLWRVLPPVVPVHWGPGGHIDGWGPSTVPGFLLPGLATGVYGALWAIAALGWGTERNLPMLRQARVLMMLFMLGVLGAIYLPPALGAGWGHVGLAIRLLVALLLLFLGNLMPRAEPAAPGRDLWKDALRRGGRLMVGAALVLLACAWLPPVPYFALMAGLTLAAGLYPYVRVQRGLDRLRAAEPRPLDAGPAGPALGAPDALALLGEAAVLACVPGTGHALAAAGLPPLLWGILFVEAELRQGGELHRARVFMRGFVTAAVASALVLALLLPGTPGHPPLAAIFGGLAAMLLVSGGGQVLARRTAPESARSAWGTGPVLWDPRDARIWVPKAMGMGASLNFAHAASWALTLGLVGLPFLAAGLF